ncbi:hypothetical protein KL930_002776 [Ogataea haglerorum]|uniref:SGS-domain-containing protein n=1 Tax=Ogataea haglerorum TaxID=1937702 RepID=A0AAN6I0Y0_9ASCO|nr:uncharacterized protein KL911_002966 [Ogataea haglerorum]KAG7691865.1 hypothetical protein KL915_004928 [Ogataea haglerorum]KAG7692701.1 hypothetical protein KL951_004948 [Ogataea haglerorum]KAG7702920.1 hypothetical protein KL950_004998 [Ogataea haglerorum]KAG7703019.1 hypothetical protein KL914_005024 [Ogataea haglerorum]KAG7728210.1 hypothetical protein KL933_002336 [Ogataea haglerorum]
MPIGTRIQEGESAYERDDLVTALLNANAALQENQDSFKALLLRSRIYLRSKKYDLALEDANKLVQIAQNNGKREDLATSYKQKAIVLFRQKQFSEAMENINEAYNLNNKDAECSMFKTMIGKKLQSDADLSVKSPASSKGKPLPQQTSKEKPKVDWYDSKGMVNVSIYVKNIPPTTLKVDFQETSVSVDFKTSENTNFSYSLDPLYGSILPSKSSFKVFGTKLELYLAKETEESWKALEKVETDTAPEQETRPTTFDYPSSSAKKVNWSEFKVDDAEEDSNQDPDAFFRKLYQGADDDTRRAMMKSYLESNGTTLSTDWKEVSQKKVDIAPPDGVDLRDW